MKNELSGQQSLLGKIDIIISTKNRLPELMVTLEHVINIGITPEQIFLVDDGSTDGTYAYISDKYKGINIKRNEISVGYMANRSNMMLRSQNKYVLSIDDDSHIRTREDIEEAVNILENDPFYGIFHFRVFNQISAPPDKNTLSHKFRFLRGYIGCGHLIKREVIEKLGRYREELVFYCEELDYSLRAFKNGYYTVGKDDIIVHHRIDVAQREKQKSTVNSKGIYGREWRNIHLYSNNLIIVAIYYPPGIDLGFIIIRFIQGFYRMALCENQWSGFFKMTKRFFSFLPYIFNNSDKLNYSQFFKWFSFPDMTDSNSH